MCKSDPIVARKSVLAEVALAGKDQRHRLVLEGKGVQERVENGGLDINIFNLQISQAKLDSLPDTLGCLDNLTGAQGQQSCWHPHLDLSSNSLSSPPPIPNFIELKTLNLSRCLLWGVHS